MTIHAAAPSAFVAIGGARPRARLEVKAHILIAMGACTLAPRPPFFRELVPRTIASPQDSANAAFAVVANAAVAKPVSAILITATEIVTSAALLRAPILPILT